MGCSISPSFSAEFIITITPYVIGAILSIISLICVVCNRSLPRVIRTILLSFSVANILGTGLLAYYNIKLYCNHGDTSVRFVIPVTVMLSLTHFALFNSSEKSFYPSKEDVRVDATLTSIILFWIISFIIGLAIVPSVRIVFGILHIISMIILCLKFVTLRKKVKRKKTLFQFYQEMYLDNEFPRAARKPYWKISFYGYMLFSYVTCAIPWAVNEIREQIQRETRNDILVHSICLIIYSLNFSFPSFICIYSKYRQYRDSSRKVQDIQAGVATLGTVAGELRGF